MGIVNRLEEKTKCTLQFLDDCLGEDGELDVWVLVEEIFRKFSDAFRVCVGLKAETLGLEKGLQFFVISNDTVVDNGEFPFRVRSKLVQFYPVALAFGTLTCVDGNSDEMAVRG